MTVMWIAERLNLDFLAANTLEVVDGRLTGKVTGEIVDRHNDMGVYFKSNSRTDFCPKTLTENAQFAIGGAYLIITEEQELLKGKLFI